MNFKSYLLFANDVDRTKKFITFCFKMNYYSFSIPGQLMLLHLLHGEYNIQNNQHKPLVLHWCQHDSFPYPHML